ncbi:MAG: hypothetical protein P1P84_09635 [Deferrisomatales bacterium]|nr:hypothetical protein [Deferrisomatales bacterium]
MAEHKTRDTRQPPEISPYVVSVLLAGFGLWCLYDGWISSNPDMQEHLTFNRVGSVVLLAWAAWDFRKVRKREKAEKAACCPAAPRSE